MKKTISMKYPGFYVRVTNNSYVSNPKGWKSNGKKINVVNTTNNPRENDIAEVIDIDTGISGDRCYLCKDIDGFMFAIDDPGVEFFAKNWPEAADRIKKEYSIKSAS